MVIHPRRVCGLGTQTQTTQNIIIAEHQTFGRTTFDRQTFEWKTFERNTFEGRTFTRRTIPQNDLRNGESSVRATNPLNGKPSNGNFRTGQPSHGGHSERRTFNHNSRIPFDSYYVEGYLTRGHHHTKVTNDTI